MNKLLKIIVSIGLIGVIVFIFQGPLKSTLTEFEARYFPCRQPIAYSLGQFDTKFGISKTDFLSAVATAEAIWEKPIGKELFNYTPDGALKINLIYDARQDATTKLKSMGIT